ncbi:MAG: MobA/MobL family protein, partial [Acidobacteria bacterium]|nr:MobA/MobL family protein [Acidobacteriota bacterium]
MLFAAADRYERANGRLYVELEGALPVELDDQQREELARAMMRETSATGLPFVYGIHAGRRRAAGEPANPHFHGLLSERINDGVGRDPAQWFRRANPGDPAAGGAAKDRSLKGHEWVADTRSLYERLVNEALERAGCPERVTAESHRTRIARAEAVGAHETAEELLLHPPSIHMGPAACAIERGGPGRPGRQTERGNLARARADEAAGLREDLESVERELKEYRQAAVAAARDAGVDETLVVAAQSGDPNEVLALDNATEQRRQEIGDAAVAVGFSRDAMECLRREAEPESHELGWWAVVAATEERQRKADAETAAQNAGLDPEAVYRAAEKQGGDAVDFLKRETANRTAEIVAAAREVHLDNQAIERIMREAKLREPGVAGWGAVVEETVARRQRLNLAELAARSLQLNTKAVRETMPTQEGDPLDVLEQEIAKRLDKIRAAPDHHDGEQRERIGIIDAAPQGWCTVSQQLVAERRRRKAHLESSARHLHLEVDRTYAKARHGDGNDDPLAHLERETEKRERKLMEEARAAFLPADEICRIRYPEAELQDGGSG